MFQENELIVYGSTGVCKVKSIGPLVDIDSAKKDRIYYTLEPMYDKGTIYAPVDSKVFMRPILSDVQARELIDKIPQLKDQNLDHGKTQRALIEEYETAINSHRCEELIRVICTVLKRNKRAADTGKKPALTDERYLKRARTLLYGELAAALQIPYDEVENYIYLNLSSQ